MTAPNYMGHRHGRTNKQTKAAEIRHSEIGRDEKKRELWIGLNQYCEDRCGAITTLPFHWPARLETPKESPLPAKLRELGWIVIDKGSETRLGPQVVTEDVKGRPTKPTFGNSYGFHQRHIYDVCLPR